MWRSILGIWTDALAKLERDSKLERSEAVSPGRHARRALEVAQGEIGKGESGRNNHGPTVRKYRGDDKAGAWCASFLGWCFERAARALGIALPFKRTHGAKAIYKRVGRAGAFVDLPMVGDVACWQRGNGSPAQAWMGHVGIVSRVEISDDGQIVRFWTVEGNRGRYPAKVAEFAHTPDERKLIGFARL